MDLEHKGLTAKIIGAAIQVHKIMGPGYIESIYEAAFALQLKEWDVPFQRQLAVPVHFREVEVGRHRLDFLIANEIVVELKSIKALEDIHFATVRSYLRAVGKSHGLLLNFAKLSLEVRRVSSRPAPPGFLGS